MNLFSLIVVYKGTASNLLKQTAKRRRTKQQIKDEKEKEELDKLEIEKKMAEHIEMQ